MSVKRLNKKKVPLNPFFRRSNDFSLFSHHRDHYKAMSNNLHLPPSLILCRGNLHTKKYDKVEEHEDEDEVTILLHIVRPNNKGFFPLVSSSFMRFFFSLLRERKISYDDQFDCTHTHTHIHTSWRDSPIWRSLENLIICY